MFLKGILFGAGFLLGVYIVETVWNYILDYLYERFEKYIGD